VRNHSAKRFGFNHGPVRVALFQQISNLHACTRRRAGPGPESHLHVRLAALHGNAINVEVHRAEVQRLKGQEVLPDGVAHRFRIGPSFSATETEHKNQQGYEQ